MAYVINREDVYLCICERCAHHWKTFALPNACAKCKTKSWNIKKGEKNGPGN